MKTEKITKIVTKEIELEILPCIECGSDNISLHNCGYTTFNVITGTCSDCGIKYDLDASWEDETRESMIRCWNKLNDPNAMIKYLYDEMEEKRKKIIEIGNRCKINLDSTLIYADVMNQEEFNAKREEIDESKYENRNYEDDTFEINILDDLEER